MFDYQESLIKYLFNKITLFSKQNNNLADAVITSQFAPADGVTILNGVAYKTFKIVVVSFVLDLGTNFPTSNTTVMNISNNRPRSSVFAVGNAYIDTASKPCVVTVNSGGAIMVQGFSGRYLAFCVTYLTY